MKIIPPDKRLLFVGLSALALSASGLTLAGCDRDTPTEDAIEEAADNVDDAAEDAADAVEDAVDDAADELDDAADDLPPES